MLPVFCSGCCPLCNTLKSAPQFLFFRVQCHVLCWSFWCTYLCRVNGDRHKSICILLNVDIQLDHHFSLKVLSFLQCVFFTCQNQVFISVLIYVWVFSKPWMNLSVFMLILCVFYSYGSVLKLEIGDGETSSRSVKNCVGYQMGLH